MILVDRALQGIVDPILIEEIKRDITSDIYETSQHTKI